MVQVGGLFKVKVSLSFVVFAENYSIVHITALLNIKCLSVKEGKKKRIAT